MTKINNKQHSPPSPPPQFGPIAPPRLQQLPQQHLDDTMAGLTRQSGEAQDSAEHRHARL
jgi:hypothetical protein